MRDLISHLNDEGVTIDVNDSDSPNHGTDLNTTQIQSIGTIVSEDGSPVNIPLGIDGIEKVEMVDVISEISETLSHANTNLAAELREQKSLLADTSSDMPSSSNLSIDTVSAEVKAVSGLNNTENVLPLTNVTSSALKGESSNYEHAPVIQILVPDTSQNVLPSSHDTAKESSPSSPGEKSDAKLSNRETNGTSTCTVSDATLDSPLNKIDRYEGGEVGEEKLTDNVKVIPMLESDNNIPLIDMKSELVNTSVQTSNLIVSSGPITSSTATANTTSASHSIGTNKNYSSDVGLNEAKQNNLMDIEKDNTLPSPNLPSPTISNILADLVDNSSINNTGEEETVISGSEHGKIIENDLILKSFDVSTNVSVPLGEVNSVSDSVRNQKNVLETVMVDIIADLGPKNPPNLEIIETSMSESSNDIEISEGDILTNVIVDESVQSLGNPIVKTIKTPVQEGFQGKIEVEEEEEEEEEREEPSPTSFPVFTASSYHPTFPSGPPTSDDQQADVIDDTMDDRVTESDSNLGESLPISLPVAAITPTPLSLPLSLPTDAVVGTINPDASVDIADGSLVDLNTAPNSSISKDEEVAAMTSETVNSTSTSTPLNSDTHSSITITTSTSLSPTATTSSSSSSVVSVINLPIEATLPVVSPPSVVPPVIPSLPSSISETSTSTTSVTSTSTTATAEPSVSVSSSSIPIPAPQGFVRVVNGPTVGLSPSCLETLRFSDFQASMAKKMKLKADSDKTQVPQNSQDNVFRQLMLKIKTLEMNYAIIEMYSAQVK